MLAGVQVAGATQHLREAEPDVAHRGLLFEQHAEHSLSGVEMRAGRVEAP
jgi:hypothetical protein